jgi:hypothetical protein
MGEFDVSQILLHRQDAVIRFDDQDPIMCRHGLSGRPPIYASHRFAETCKRSMLFIFLVHPNFVWVNTATVIFAQAEIHAMRLYGAVLWVPACEHGK